MRKLVLLLTVFCSTSLFGQNGDSLSVKLDYGANDEELRFYFKSKGIDLYKLKISNLGKSPAKLTLVSKEVFLGELKKVDTLFSWRDYKSFLLGVGQELNAKVLTDRVAADSIRFNFDFSSFSTFREYKTLLSDNYSLRDAVLSHGAKIKIATKSISPILVYSLPYEDSNRPGYLFYCELTAKNVDPKEWYQKYGIAHYIIFDLIVE